MRLEMLERMGAPSGHTYFCGAHHVSSHIVGAVEQVEGHRPPVAETKRFGEFMSHVGVEHDLSIALLSRHAARAARTRGRISSACAQVLRELVDLGASP